jgi:hypothetical protein
MLVCNVVHQLRGSCAIQKHPPKFADKFIIHSFVSDSFLGVSPLRFHERNQHLLVPSRQVIWRRIEALDGCEPIILRPLSSFCCERGLLLRCTLSGLGIKDIQICFQSRYRIIPYSRYHFDSGRLKWLGRVDKAEANWAF